jgi:hypothetical protein
MCPPIIDPVVVAPEPQEKLSAVETSAAVIFPGSMYWLRGSTVPGVGAGGDVRAQDAVRVLPRIGLDDAPHHWKNAAGALVPGRELLAGGLIDETGAVVNPLPDFEPGLRRPGMRSGLAEVAKYVIV